MIYNIILCDFQQTWFSLLKFGSRYQVGYKLKSAYFFTFHHETHDEEGTAPMAIPAQAGV